MDERNVMVSIYCLAYNHEQYIRDTLEGFINQKTKFRYEVIVHDDASTDNTATIIKEYAEKYPHIIKPVLQKKNQHSQGVQIVKEILFPLLTGKYIAICEGDDYLFNCYKIQKQVEFLEEHQEYSACVHNTKMYNVKENKIITMCGEKVKDLELEDVIYYGGQSYHTSSVMCRSNSFKATNDYKYIIDNVGDYPLSISLIQQGMIHYFPEVMSVYRYGTPNSWSSRSTRERCIKVYSQSIEMLKLARAEFQDLYQEAFQKAISRYEYEIKKAERDYSVLQEEKYKVFYKQETVINKIKIQINKILSSICK